MVFSSNLFMFLFLPLVLVGYYLLRYNKLQNYFLLMASIFFYFWGEGKQVLIILASIVLNYLMGLLVNLSKKKILKRSFLTLAVVLNLLLLIYYKYFDFLISISNEMFRTEIPLKNIALPIGISFFTFQGLTYVIDLYWGNVEVQKNPLKVGLYISLFPQLIAGPIVRYKDVAEQIDQREHSINKFSDGIVRFVEGLSKKLILSNGTGFIADSIFNNPYTEHSIWTAWLGIICYTLQIYMDFSGYSDMAIGLGKMFGFEFLENFDLPYISSSIREFWRRWHISLSSFFRDYVYIPLGGNRKGNVYVNNIIVFLLTGLWHGASWNFVVWGLWHGLFIILERVLQGGKTDSEKIKIPKMVKHVVTLLIVMIGWVFFRANDLEYALGYLGRMFAVVPMTMEYYQVGYYLTSYNIFVILISVFVAFGGARNIKYRMLECKNGVLYRNIITMLLLAVCIIYVMNATYNPFIYFRF